MSPLHVRPWEGALERGVLVRRYERFIAEVRVGGRLVRAHCVNPGRMEGLVRPGAPAWLSRSPNPDRALAHTLELLELDGVLIGANTVVPNRLVKAALTAKAIPGWEDVEAVEAERPLGRGHLVDFVVRRAGVAWHVEVKNSHLVYPDGGAYFPDSVSARATAHVQALARLARRGQRAAVIFTLLRADGEVLRPTPLHDPTFAAALHGAQRAGVVLLGLRFLPSVDGFTLAGMVPVDATPRPAASLESYARALADESGWERKDGGVAGRSAPVTATAARRRRASRRRRR